MSGKTSRTLPELLVPAGNPEKLETALLYGADAVYLSGESHNLRAGSEGFTPAELIRAVALARRYGTKIYYCLNSLPRQEDMRLLPAVIEETAAAGVGAFIVADPGVLRLALRHAPGVPLHLSTQANTGNSESAAFWAEQGVSRVNLARELSRDNIDAVRRACPGVELEVFVHGAMCLAVSGQCLLSAWLNDRPSNQGRCTQPCRFEYRPADVCSSSLAVEERTRPGEILWTARREGDFTSLWAPDDLCLMHFLPWFMACGIDGLKIEGRMKGAGYVAHVADAYSTALRRIRDNGPASFEPRPYMRELMYTASRPLGSGFFLPERRDFSAEFMAGEGAIPGKTPFGFTAQPLLAKVGEPVGGTGASCAWRIQVRGAWSREDPVELMLPGMERPLLLPGEYALENHRGEIASAVGSGIEGVLRTDSPHLRPGIFIRASVPGAEERES